MNLKRLRKTMGCLALAGAMIMTLPQVAFAAEERTDATEKAQEVNSESGTEPLTESDTEELTEPQTESASESETRMQTEPQTQVQSNSDISVTEPETTPVTETDSSTEPGTENELDDAAREKQDRDRKNEIKTISPSEDVEEPEDHSDANADLTTNVIAGNAIYLEELSTVYHLTFEEGFSEVMEEIEEDFCQWLDKPEEFRGENWQDVLAVYILRMREQTGKQEVVLNAGAKEELEKIFFFMNVRSGSIITKKLSKEVDLEAEICSLDINDYAELKNLGDEEKAVLTKYTDEECKKLCTVATAAKGFVRGEVSEVSGDVSDARAAIAVAACSLVGKVGYFWGGKSYAIGWDPRWGDDATVTAGGSRSTGTTRGYGLDCSGFVCWAYYNGLGGTDGGIGNHTTTQWNATEMIDSSEAKPGDLVFYAPPTAGDQNHVGMVIGKNDDGSLIVVHCSSSQNGVVVGEAWSSGFKYVRRAAFLG